MSETLTVERNSPLPAWAQVMRDVRRRIEEGELESGSKIPTENELASSYGVSRITVRQALAELASEGFIDRRQGTGTFVAERAIPIQHDLQLSSHWRGRFEEAGHNAMSEEIRSTETREAPHILLRELPEDARPSKTAYLPRLHSVDGKPIGITESWLNVDVDPKLEHLALLDGSLSRALEETLNLRPAATDNFLEVGLASFGEAQHLNTYADAPLFVVLSVSRTQDNQILELSRTVWISNRVRFHFQS
jgi:GntR family transcriptional regulator